MTLHNAKGLEFAAVFVLGLEQNLFPHARSIEEANLEEERRLCYVAITRARERLTLLYARERTLFGQRGRNQPSQFLAEIPADLVVHERLGVSSLSRSDTRGATSYGAGRPSTSGMPSRPAPKAPRDDLPVLKVGDNVRHTQLGEGVVLSLDAGGQVVVRFRSDGSERRLLLAYAPLDRM
jgi:DNA helicase-2/ATP-dependent DNA helicase PcrA